MCSSAPLLPPPLRAAEPFPIKNGKGFSSLIPIIYITMYMAEREGFEPSIPLLAEYTISNRAPSASRASLRDLNKGEILLTINTFYCNFFSIRCPRYLVKFALQIFWRRGWDSNPRPEIIGNRFSRAAP